MEEFDNVKEALKDAIEIAESKGIKTKAGNDKYHSATAEDIQELMQERLYNIADLLGMSDLYLNEKD
ncbi:hypothetical protein [Pediococcus acidilactici]|uniref:hypothetical protein n=1 Tax=Pediococcus acidilactici TaxID=1254 RepID=UPI001330B4D7|nr:hypothetical protein [Pediococcus acidilactici]KAF0552540.1 hypothetical protein GBP46_07615 [Pediococcus acidilactici]